MSEMISPNRLDNPRCNPPNSYLCKILPKWTQDEHIFNLGDFNN